MLAGGYSWRLYFYVLFAFSVGLLIVAFIFVEETRYDRAGMKAMLAASTTSIPDKGMSTVQETSAVPPERKPFISTMKPWSSIDYEAPFFMTMIRSFTYFLVPSVLWVITTYGTFPYPLISAVI